MSLFISISRAYTLAYARTREHLPCATPAKAAVPVTGAIFVTHQPPILMDILTEEHSRSLTKHSDASTNNDRQSASEFSQLTSQIEVKYKLQNSVMTSADYAVSFNSDSSDDGDVKMTSVKNTSTVQQSNEVTSNGSSNGDVSSTSLKVVEEEVLEVKKEKKKKKKDDKDKEKKSHKKEKKSHKEKKSKSKDKTNESDGTEPAPAVDTCNGVDKDVIEASGHVNGECALEKSSVSSAEASSNGKKPEEASVLNGDRFQEIGVSNGFIGNEDDKRVNDVISG